MWRDDNNPLPGAPNRPRTTGGRGPAILAAFAVLAGSPREAPAAPDAAPVAAVAQPATTDPLPPTGIEEELSEIRPGVAIKRELDALAEQTNLRIGAAATFLFQHATEGPGLRSAGGGDLDLLAKWTAIGAGTKDTGILAFSGEYRFQIDDQPPSALGSQIGTLLPTTNGFSERPPIVKELYWDQRLFEDHFRFALGRIDPENLFGGHRLQSANTFFMYKAFSSNPTVAFPSVGAGAAAQVKPVSWLYFTAGLSNANANATTIEFDSFFDEHEYLTFGELGFTPTIGDQGAGRYRLALWHLDERDEAGRPSDEGITVSLDQDFGESITAFARYGHADGDVTNITDSVQAGCAIENLLDDEDLFGVAAAWSEPRAEGLSAEKTIEVFERIQVFETVQFTIGAELIMDPSNAPEDDLIGVLSARLRVSF